MAKMGYAREDMPRVKAELTRIMVTGKVRNHPKTAIIDNFVQFYLPLEAKQTIIYKEELERLGIKREDFEMMLERSEAPFSKGAGL